MITVKLYNYKGDNRTVNKSLSDGVTINGILYTEFNFVTPMLKIRSAETPNFNYLYIEKLKRYYFISSVVIAGKNTFELHLNLDVLKTYESQIMDSTATCVRSEDGDKYVSTHTPAYNVKPNFEKVEFGEKDIFSNTTRTKVLVTING